MLQAYVTARGLIAPQVASCQIHYDQEGWILPGKWVGPEEGRAFALLISHFRKSHILWLSIWVDPKAINSHTGQSGADFGLDPSNKT